MKTFFLSLALACGLMAQTSAPNDYVAAGVAFNQGTNQLSGFASYAVKVTGGTYSYTVLDFSNVHLKPTLNYQVAPSTGIAQYLKTIGKVDLFGLASAGAAVGTTTAGPTVLGASFSGGVDGVIGIKNGWSVNIPVRVLHTSVGGTQYLIGVGLAWGK